MKQKFLVMTSSLFATLAYAHPGEHHGGLLAGLLHLVSEPDHLALLLLAVAVGLSGAVAWRRRLKARKQAAHR